MKVSTKATTETKVVPNQFVPLEHIINHPKLSYRSLDAEHVDMLMHDIAVNGLDQPINTFTVNPTEMVKLKGTNEPFPATYLAAGLHRRAAIQKLRRDQPEVFKKRFPNGIPVLHRQASLADAMLLQIRENVNRREMSAEEIFPVLQKLTEEPYNMTGKEIAKKVGKSTAWVSQMLAVNEELDEETKEEVTKGEISVGDARNLASEVRKERKSGKAVSKSEIRAKATSLKQKQANKAASGTLRATGEDRKLSLKKLYGRFQALPAGTLMGRKLQLLTNAIEYTLGVTKKLEPEFKLVPKKTVAPAAKGKK